MIDMSFPKKLYRKIIFFIVNHFFSGTHFFGIKRFLLNSAPDVQIGAGTKVVGPICSTGKLTVGSHCWIGHDFRVEGNGSVQIGDHCNVAPFVYTFTGSHQIGEHERRAGTGYNGEIRIGNGCWICGRSTMLVNAVIQDGSIVSAGAVVLGKAYPPDSLLGGVPAKLIRDLRERHE